MMKAQASPRSPDAEKVRVALKLHNQEEEISSRACKIWQEQGCLEGLDEMYRWLAEQETPGISPGDFTT